MKKRVRVSFVILLLSVAAVSVAVDYPSRPPEQEIDAHDPAVLMDGNRFYVYGTHNMPVWRSRDLILFERVEDRLIREAPEAARKHVGGNSNDLWAPDMVKVGNEYRLYYCLSRFGMSQSYIGFLTGKTPTGSFREGSGVISSVHPPEEPGGPNALDPCVLTDANKKQWMVYGSFFGGIYILKLDRDGEARGSGSVGERIAFRQNNNTALEGPCAIYNPALKEYYLFVSYDKLDSTYNVRVGRSKRPDGPYKDYTGKNMAGPEDNLPKILNSYAFAGDPGWHGPGHNSVVCDGENYFLLHHARFEQNGRRVVRTHVRKMVFTDEGWPVVSPERYAGEKEQPIPKKEMAGDWEFLPINPDDNTLQHALPGLVFEENGTLHYGNETGTWEIKPPDSLHFKLGKRPEVSARILPAWDWENDRKTLVFTGLDHSGAAVWGKMGKR